MSNPQTRRPTSSRRPAADRVPRWRRLNALIVHTLAVTLALPSTPSLATPPQRTTQPNRLPPSAPVPVEIVTPLGPDVPYGPPGDAGGELPGQLGVVGPPSVSVGSAARTASDPPAMQPGIEPESGPLPNADARVSLRAEDQDVRQVLGLIGHDAQVNILISPGVTGTVRIDLQDVTFRQALDAVLKLASLGARQENGLVYVYTLPELDALRGRERRPMVRVYHLNYVRAADLQQMIQPFLSSDGAMTTTPLAAMGLGGGAAGLGGGSGSSGVGSVGASGSVGPTAGGSASNAVDTGGNTMAYHDVMIVRDFPDNLMVIDEIVKRLDVQPPQVLIEAVIMSVRLRDEQELGVNFSIVDNLERLAAVSGDGNAINAAAGFTPARVLAADVTRPGPSQLVPGYLNPLQGLKFGFISNNVSGFIRAVETFNKVNILASPRVLVLNKQRAEIQLGQRLGFRNTVTNLTSSLQTVEFLSVGTLLTLRPYVSNDGMIRLEIHPEKSTGALDSQGIPQTNTSELTTNILVPDGATIVIGGLIDDDDSSAEQGTPGLNRLPVVGALFRGRRTSTTKNELIVLLTPRVLRQGGLPDPVPGVAPHGVMGLPNSGAMPGPALAPPGGLVDELGRPLQGPVIAPPPSFRVQLNPLAAGSVPTTLAPPPETGAEHAPFSPPSATVPARPPADPPPATGVAPPASSPPPPQPMPPGSNDPARPPLTRNIPAPVANPAAAGALPPTTPNRPPPGALDPAARTASLEAAATDGRNVTSGPLPTPLHASTVRVTDHEAPGRSAFPSPSPAPAPVPPQANGPGWRHVVRPGEDFVGIAQRYYGTPGFHRALWGANRSTVARPDALRAGQTIVIPPAAALDLAAGELPSPLNQRERARSPAPHQPVPSPSRRGPRRSSGSGLFPWWPGTRGEPEKAGPLGGPSGSSPAAPATTDRDKSSTAPRPSPLPTLPALAAAPTASPYHPGDITRSLLHRLLHRDRPATTEEEGPDSLIARLRATPPDANPYLASRRPSVSVEPASPSSPILWPSTYFAQRNTYPIGLTAQGQAVRDPAILRTSLTEPVLIQRLQSPEPITSWFAGP